MLNLMIITICGSLSFAKRMKKIKSLLEMDFAHVMGKKALVKSFDNNLKFAG